MNAKQIVYCCIVLAIFLSLSCGDKKKYKEAEKKEVKAEPVPMVVYKDAGPHPMMQIIKDVLQKYPVQTFNVKDNTSSRRSSLSPKPIKTLRLEEYYLIYTPEDSSEVWCWNLRQYSVVIKIMQNDVTATGTKPKVIRKKDEEEKTDTITTSESAGYHLYISLN